MLFGQIPEITIVNEASPVWRDLVTTAVPAFVALLVVYLGGRQQAARQRDDVKASERRWQEQQVFDRTRWAMAERRRTYSAYLSTLDSLGYLTTHALGHMHPHHPPLCEDHQEDAWQEWMTAHNRLSQLTQDVLLIGSLEFYDLVLSIDELFRELDLPGAGDEDQTAAVQAWFFNEEGAEPGPAWVRFKELHNLCLLTARDEVNALPEEDRFTLTPDDT